MKLFHSDFSGTDNLVGFGDLLEFLDIGEPLRTGLIHRISQSLRKLLVPMIVIGNDTSTAESLIGDLEKIETEEVSLDDFHENGEIDSFISASCKSIILLNVDVESQFIDC